MSINNISGTTLVETLHLNGLESVLYLCFFSWPVISRHFIQIANIISFYYGVRSQWLCSQKALVGTTPFSFQASPHFLFLNGEVQSLYWFLRILIYYLWDRRESLITESRPIVHSISEGSKPHSCVVWSFIRKTTIHDLHVESSHRFSPTKDHDGSCSSLLAYEDSLQLVLVSLAQKSKYCVWKARPTALSKFKGLYECDKGPWTKLTTRNLRKNRCELLAKFKFT